jgi:hypothetical protein
MSPTFLEFRADKVKRPADNQPLLISHKPHLINWELTAGLVEADSNSIPHRFTCSEDSDKIVFSKHFRDGESKYQSHGQRQTGATRNFQGQKHRKGGTRAVRSHNL